MRPYLLVSRSKRVGYARGATYPNVNAIDLKQTIAWVHYGEMQTLISAGPRSGRLVDLVCGCGQEGVTDLADGGALGWRGRRLPAFRGSAVAGRAWSLRLRRSNGNARS